MDTSQQSEYRQSSPDVQVAYNHFRQFRQDLLELSDNLHARIVAEENFIGPGHEAIVLTEPLEDASPESQDSSVDNARSRNNRTLSHPVSLSSPLMATRPPSRRPMAESHLRHTRDLDPDDPNTLLGRRVAARVAASADHQPSQSLDRSLPNPPSENTLFSQQRLGPDELSGNQADTGHNDHSFAHRRTILSSQALFAARAPIQSQSSPETQRPGTEYSARQQTQFDRPDRLSLLSNFSVQNFSTPRSGTLIRPLIFEEPASYVDQDSLQYSSTLDPLVEDEISTRSYIVHRRLNADGEEYVHNINLHWNEGKFSCINL
ncbi:hypothetical protein BDQ17DRAFT_1320310 [Cyathus striatus]|nr:hypothetical protein BDQ17DRAFT_1320310 [Cyathus striatus]